MALSGRTITFHLTRPDPEWPQKLALPPAALLPPSMGTAEIGTDVSRLVGTGPYYWASYAPARQLVLRRNPYFKVWAPAAQPDGYVDRIVQRFGLGAEAEVTEVERGRADWVVDDIPPDRLPELLRRFASQLHDNQSPAVLVRRAQRQHRAVRPARGAAGRQSRHRPERDREALRRAAVRRADLPGAPARLPGLRALLPVDARRHGALVGARSGARPPARRRVGHRRRPGRHRRRQRRRAEGDRRVHSGRAVQARIRPAREGAPGRRPVRLRAELAQPGRGGARAVEQDVPGAVRLCSTACSAATPSCRTPTPAPTSAGSATARRSSR